MAEDKRISELPVATEPLNDADLVEVVQGGVNKKAPKSAFGGGGVTDGDKGDIVVSSSGTVWTVDDASESQAGKIEIATQAETNAGTDDGRAITPLKLASRLAPLTNSVYRTETATHDLDATDLGNINLGKNLIIILNSAGAISLEIPLNANVAFPVGTKIGWIQYGAGQITVTPLSTVVLRSPNAANKSFAQYSMGEIEKIGADEWVLRGDITV